MYFFREFDRVDEVGFFTDAWINKENGWVTCRIEEEIVDMFKEEANLKGKFAFSTQKSC